MPRTELTQSAIEQHQMAWKYCRRCPIGCLAHKHVFFRGVLPCEILFIGEAPGKTEDVIGLPFVGLAGKLLDRWIDSANKQQQFSWAITNLISCRPTDRDGGPNRAPSLEEISNCRERLIRFISISQPRGVVTLGKPARENLPALQLPVLHLTHPAAMLYSKEPFEGPRQQIQILRLTQFIKEIL